MNQPFELLDYKATPWEKYFLGIATVRLYGKIVLRLKQVQTKDKKGYFFTGPSYTIDEQGEKQYLQAIVIDSRAEEEALQSFLRGKLKEFSAHQPKPAEVADIGDMPF
jgi:hypothetical protein